MASPSPSSPSATRNKPPQLLHQQQHYHYQQQQHQFNQFQNQQHFLFQHHQHHHLIHHHHQQQQQQPLLHLHHHHHQHQNQLPYPHPIPTTSTSASNQPRPTYPQPLINPHQFHKNPNINLSQQNNSLPRNNPNHPHSSPNYLRSRSAAAAQTPLPAHSFPLPPPPSINSRHHHHPKFNSSDQRRQRHSHRQPPFRSTSLALPHPSLPKPPRSDRPPIIHTTQAQAFQQSTFSNPTHPSSPRPSPIITNNNNNSINNNNNNNNRSASTTPTNHRHHVHSPSTSTLQSSFAPDEHLGLGGPQSCGYLPPSAVPLNPWRGCSPCKWKVPLTPSGLPQTSTSNHPNADDMTSIDEEQLEESECQLSTLEQEEWKIRWAKLRITEEQTSDQQVGLKDLQNRLTHQLHSLNLRFVFELDRKGPGQQQALIVWLYEIPGCLSPKQSTLENPTEQQEPIPLVDPALKNIQFFNLDNLITKEITIQDYTTVLSHGVLSHSQLFPNIFTRVKTSNPKPFLPHLSHSAKNKAGNDFLVEDSRQTHTIPAYANLLRVLNQHVIALAVRSTDSTAFPGAPPTRWIRWGLDRLLSVPRDESLECLYRNLNHESARLFGAILATPPALVVELNCWLSSRVAMCQPSFTARRLAPMPTFPQHSIPPGFPIILAPFPNFRAQYVRMFGRFDHQSITRYKARLSSQSPSFQAGRSSSSWEIHAATDAAWLSRQKKICRAELKHFEKLKQTWREAVPFMEPNPEPSSYANANHRTLESWVVCKLTPEVCDEGKVAEIELVWPVDHCLLDLETWITKAEQSPMTSEQAATRSDPATQSTSAPSLSRARMANSLLRSTYVSTDELAEDAGSYIDLVAQERELQRRAAAVASKDQAKEKTESPPPTMSTRVGLGYNRSKGATYLSPRFQRHASASAARASPGSLPIITTPLSSRKRQREESTHITNPFDDTAEPAKDERFAQPSDPAGQQPVLAEPPVPKVNEEAPLENRTTHSSSSVVLATQLVITSSQFVSAQRGSGSGSTASTISYNTNLFEQPTPGSVSISGLTPGRLNGFTPDFNPPSVQTAIQSSPIHSHQHLHHESTLQLESNLLPESSAQHQVDPLVRSENAFRTLSLIQVPSGSAPPAATFRVIEPAGYESVQFSDSHSVSDDHYTRRGGKYALPPSPCSFTAPEDDQEDAMDLTELRESLRLAKDSSLVHVSKKLLQAMDPRTKVARGFYQSVIPSPRVPVTEPPFYTRVVPLSIKNTTSGAITYAESPATPRSWVPIGSPTDSPESSACSDEEEESENHRFHRSIASSPSKSSTSSDDENLMEVDQENYDETLVKIGEMKDNLHKVLQSHYQSYFSFGFNDDVLDETNKIPTQVVPSSMKRKLKNFVSQLGAQLEHDPNVETLLYSFFPSSLPKPSTTNENKTMETRTGSETVLDSALLPMINGLDYYKSRIDDGYEIQENRKEDNSHKEVDGEKEVGQQKTKEERDSRPFLIKKLNKLTPSVVVKINDGKQKITFSLISQLYKYWIKLGFEPISGQRNFVLSIIFPPNKRKKKDSLLFTDLHHRYLHHCSVSHWLLELAHTYKSLKLGEITVGRIHDSKHKSNGLKMEIEEMIQAIKCSTTTRHTCLIVVDTPEDMKGLMIGADEIKGLDGSPVTRLIVSRNHFIDDRPSNLISFAFRLYDSMKILVDRFKAPGLVLHHSQSIISSSHPHPLLRDHLNSMDESSSDSDYTSDQNEETLETVAKNNNNNDKEQEDTKMNAIETRKADTALDSEIDKRRRRGIRRILSMFKKQDKTKLVSEHAFFLNGFQRPTQFNLSWPPNGIDVCARHRLLHVGYFVDPNRCWVLVSTLDELGHQYQVVLKFLDPTQSRRRRRDRRFSRRQQEIVDSINNNTNNSGGNKGSKKKSPPPPLLHNQTDDDTVDRTELVIAKSVWKVVRKILLASNVEWKIVITKLGKMNPVEYQAWCELLSKILPVSELAFHVSLTSVMMTEVPILKRIPSVIEPTTTTSSSTSNNTNQGPQGGVGVGETVEAGSDLEMGEVGAMEEGEESNEEKSQQVKIEDEIQLLAASDRLFVGPEPIWVFHESVLRPHSIYNSNHQEIQSPSSVNETIVHCLSTSYLYHMTSPSQNSPQFKTSGGEKVRIDLLGTGSTSCCVYQYNLFQHREEITSSFVQLCKLNRLRRSFNPLLSNGIGRGGATGSSSSSDLLLPIHLDALTLLAPLFHNHFTLFLALFQDLDLGNEGATGGDGDGTGAESEQDQEQDAQLPPLPTPSDLFPPDSSCSPS